MKIIKLDFQWKWPAILFKDLWLIISKDYYVRIDDINNIEDILYTYFSYVIKWHWCDRCWEYDKLKNYINYSEIDTDNLIDDYWDL